MIDWLDEAAKGKRLDRYDNDRFGIPKKPIEKEASSQLQWREATTKFKAEMVLAEIFINLRLSLGESSARKLFDPYKTLQLLRKRGSHGERDSSKNEILLRLYDRLAENSPRICGVPRMMAVALHRDQPGLYGNSAEAIEKQIRRLVKARTNKQI
jgi:hypothetical protein